MSFTELGLSEKVLQAVTASGYTEPTPIQAQAIPHVLARRDVLGIAQTGTGKTAAFTLPMLTLLETGRARARMPRTLVLEPTRELAAQVEESFDRYGIHHRLNVALLIGGVSFGDQDMKITRGVDVLIATPGRLLDHFERGKLLLSGVELLVIDEADRMLDMGFIPDIERIVKLVPFTRQTLFFSATMPPEITRLASEFLHNPVRVEVARPATAAETIVQRLIAVGSEPHDKRERLRDLIRSAPDFKNAIIFCNRKRDVAVLHRSLQRHSFVAAALHGDLDQRARMAALESFRNGEVPLLVASDVAARGLDIPAVSHVLNFDVPHHAEDYIHRIGRTGRAGRTGHAFTLVTPEDSKSLSAIERLIGGPIPWEGGDLSALGPAQTDGRKRRPEARGTRGRGERPERAPEGRRVRRAARPMSEEERAREAAGEPREPREIPSRESHDPATDGRRPVPEAREPVRRAREPVSEAGEPVREGRQPVREARARAPAEERPRSPERRPAGRPRSEEPRTPSRDPAGSGREPGEERESGPAVTGLGDHVPAFLLRPTFTKSKT